MQSVFHLFISFLGTFVLSSKCELDWKLTMLSGFEVVDKGCCGTGSIEVVILCNRYMSSTCEDDTKYLFWDSYHPSERGYRILVDQMVKKYINSFTWTWMSRFRMLLCPNVKNKCAPFHPSFITVLIIFEFDRFSFSVLLYRMCLCPSYTIVWTSVYLIVFHLDTLKDFVLLRYNFLRLKRNTEFVLTLYSLLQ